MWTFARDAAGAAPFIGDLESLKRRFPSNESRSTYLDLVHERMQLAEHGELPWDLVAQMKVAPDVLEIRLPVW